MKTLYLSIIVGTVGIPEFPATNGIILVAGVIIRMYFGKTRVHLYN